jgi:colicin import membrane protein
MPRSADRITPPPTPDPYRYGWRFVKKLLPDGSTDLIQVPLTLEDVLHPQEGDVIPESTHQERDAEYLRPIFRDRVARLPGGYFLADCLIDWNVPGIRNHAPDLTAFRDVLHPPVESIGTFRVRHFGGRCVLAVEIVSPDTRENDVVHKWREYHQVRVPLYVLIDQEREHGPRSVVAHRYTARRYVRMRPDRQGRILLKPLGLWLAVEDELAVCYDADTGERLSDYGEERQARVAAQQEAREQAEARQHAERQAREQAEGRQHAERRVRELEAELRRLRGETT